MDRNKSLASNAMHLQYRTNLICAVPQQNELGMQVYCIRNPQTVSVLCVAVPFTLLLYKPFSSLDVFRVMAKGGGSMHQSEPYTYGTHEKELQDTQLEQPVALCFCEFHGIPVQ